MEQAQLTPRESEALDALARLIHRQRLTTPALLFLGAMRPIHRLAADALQFALPWLDSLVPTETARTLRDLLERPDGVTLVSGLLVDRLDVLDRA